MKTNNNRILIKIFKNAFAFVLIFISSCKKNSLNKINHNMKMQVDNCKLFITGNPIITKGSITESLVIDCDTGRGLLLQVNDMLDGRDSLTFRGMIRPQNKKIIK